MPAQTNSQNKAIFQDADSGFVDEFLKEINIMNDINNRFEKDVTGRATETMKRYGQSEEDILRFPPTTGTQQSTFETLERRPVDDP